MLTSSDQARAASAIPPKLSRKRFSLSVASAAALIGEFKDDPPTLAILKHMNPCGVGQGADLKEAWDKAFAADRPVVIDHWDGIGRGAVDLDAAWPNLAVANDQIGLIVLGLKPECMPPRQASGRTTP